MKLTPLASKHRWTYFLRTLPDIQDLLEPLENAISQVLIPAITECKCNQLDRNILALPIRLGAWVWETRAKKQTASTLPQSK